MKRIIYILPALVLLFTWSSCTDDLDTKPLDPNSDNPDKVYSIEANYYKNLLKVYSVLALSGQDGSGSSDIEGVDAGNAQLYRCWWTLQEVPTDETIFAWDNDWVLEINEMKWTTASNEVIEGLYQRCMYIVAVANEFLKETTDDKMSSRGMTESFMQQVHQYRYEARFMRALAYYMLLDTYGNPPFITENNYSATPKQLSRSDLFDWIETELVDLSKNLAPGRTVTYGRADQAAAYALLSRLYLNAKVYTGTERYTDCITASKAVISAGYSLAPSYANLFRADNQTTSASEIIFAIVFDGQKTKSFGGTTFLISGSRGVGEMSVEADGIQYAWAGMRARPDLVKKFDFSNPNYANDHDAASIKDKRGNFFAENRTLDIQDWSRTFETQGWAVYKYSNLKSDGTPGSDQTFSDTDIPLLRLGEVYLNYAEAVLRGGEGGDINLAVSYINQLRARGYNGTIGDISKNDLTVNFILDERARELHWEALRRTDLIRYDYFTTNTYLWNFKGGVKSGKSVESYRNIYPIPVSDMSVNPSLDQNTGYN